MNVIGAQRAALLVGDILDRAAGVAKADNPLSSRGFMTLVRRMSSGLKSAAAHHEAVSLRQALDALSADWPNMTKGERENHIRAAQDAIERAATTVSTATAEVLRANMQRVVLETKRTTIGNYELPIRPTLDLVDQRVIDHAASSQAHYVTNEFGERAKSLGASARAIVAGGLEQGLDRYAIGKQLRAQIGDQLPGRAGSYWEVVASIYAARSRTYGQLASFDEAGIESFQFDAVLDEVTSTVCRLMHGRVFSVGKARARFAEVAASEDPEDVKELQPFLGVATADDGSETIYFNRGGERVAVANVLENAEGSKDKTGQFSHVMANAKMEENGITTPPLHGHCRSTLVPVFDASPPAPAPRAPRAVAVRAPREPKPRPPAPALTPPTPAVGVEPWDLINPSTLVPPPRYSVIAPPVPGKNDLPVFADSSGSKLRPYIDLGGPDVKALENLYKMKPENLAKASRLGGELPKDFDRTEYARALHEATRGRDLGQLAHEKGELVAFGPSDLAKLHASEKFNRDVVAGYMVGSDGADRPLNGKEYDKLPIVIRSQGRLFVQAGSEKILAEQLRFERVAPNGSSVYCRVVDLEKCTPGKPLDAERTKAIAKRASEALDAITAEGAGNGHRTKMSDQLAVRESVREILKSHDVVTRDDRRHNLWSDFKFPIVQARADGFSIHKAEKMAGAAADHAFGDGAVRARSSVARESLVAFRELAKNPDAFRGLKTHDVEQRLHGIRVLIHEELHGASNARLLSYDPKGPGVGMEEAATEILARKMTRDLAGHPLTAQSAATVPFGLPVHGTHITAHDGSPLLGSRVGYGRPAGSRGSYDEYITHLFEQVAELTGHEGIHERIENALLATRRWNGGRTKVTTGEHATGDEFAGSGWNSGADQVRAFGEALGLDAQKQNELVTRLTKVFLNP